MLQVIQKGKSVFTIKHFSTWGGLKCFQVSIFNIHRFSIGERLKTISVEVPRLPQAAVKVGMGFGQLLQFAI